jgi:hypothetical protein
LFFFFFFRCRAGPLVDVVPLLLLLLQFILIHPLSIITNTSILKGKEHLKKNVILLQIPVIANLPVGDNLQDHVFIDYNVGVKDPVTTTPEDLDSFWTWLQYTFFKTGTNRQTDRHRQTDGRTD